MNMQNIILTPIAVSDLVNLIANEMDSRMAARKLNPETTLPTPEPDKRLYGDKAAAEYLGCSVLTIAKLRRSGQIPFYRYGARYYFIAQQLDAALKHEARRFGELRGRRATNGK